MKVKKPILTKKGKAIIISVSVIIGLCLLFLLSVWCYGFSKHMSFKDTMISIFDNEKYDLQREVVSLSKVKLDFEKSLSDMENNVSKQTDTISILQGQIDRNNEIIAELNKNKAENLNQITVLRKENESLARVIDNLTDSNNLTNTTISMMSQQLTEINALLKYYISLNEKTYSDFVTLRQKNSELEKELTAYRKMVASARNDGYKIITFMVNDEIHDVRICKTGDYFNVGITDKVEDTDSYIFDYWVYDNQEVKSSIRITEDTVIKAHLIDIRNMITFNTSNMQSQPIIDDATGQEYEQDGSTLAALFASVEVGKTYCFEFTCVDTSFYDVLSFCCVRNNYLSSFDGGSCQSLGMNSATSYKVGEKYRIIFQVKEGNSYFCVCSANGAISRYIA